MSDTATVSLIERGFTVAQHRFVYKTKIMLVDVSLRDENLN